MENFNELEFRKRVMNQIWILKKNGYNPVSIIIHPTTILLIIREAEKYVYIDHDSPAFAKKYLGLNVKSEPSIIESDFILLY